MASPIDIGFSILVVSLIIIWTGYKTCLIMSAHKRRTKEILEAQKIQEKELENIVIKSEGVLE